MLFGHTENWAIPILFCRKLLWYVYIPVIQNVLGVFQTTVWNNHSVRKQENKDLRTWVPEHIFSFPEKYGSKNYGLNITEEQLFDIAMECDIFDSTDDHLSKDFRRRREMQFVGRDEIEPEDANTAYLYLKEYFVWIWVIQYSLEKQPHYTLIKCLSTFFMKL